MEILTDIKVKGEVFMQYGYLIFDFLFKNDNSSSVYAEYCFNLPEEAVISSAMIVADCKRINMSVVSYTHAAALESGADMLRRLDENRYYLKIGVDTKGESKVRIRVYTPIGNELKIPLSCEGAEAEVQLTFRGIESAESNTHNTYARRDDDKLILETGRIKADRDLGIRIKPVSRGNMAVVTRDVLCGRMLCRLRYDESLSGRYKRILLLCDRMSLYGNAFSAAREFMCAVAELWQGELAAALTDENGGLIWDYSDNTAENLSEFVKVLSEENIIKTFNKSDYINGETLPVMICGEYAEDTEELYLVTMGARACRKIKCKKREHIYGRDNIKLRAGEIIKSFTAPEVRVQAYSDCNIIKVLRAEESFCDLFISYIGERVPRDFTLDVNGTVYSARAELLEVYDSFRWPELVYAKIMSDELERRLGACTPDEVIEIRNAMEALGKEFSFINSEVVLATEAGNRIIPVRTCVSDNIYTDVFKNKRYVFRESNEVLGAIEGEDVYEQCVEAILMNVRSCGGIFTIGETNGNMQRYQTVVAYLGLVAAGLQEEYSTVLRNAEGFLAGYENNRLKLTQSRADAARQLMNLPGDEGIIYEGIPDLLTAAKLLCKNNSRFC